MSKKVVFFFPSFASSEATAPLGILAVATPLLRAGFSVKLIDSTITPNFKKRVLEEVRDALCLAISLVTGPMIRETVDIARSVKMWNPDFPIILGGWHPSLLPKQTLEAPFIDIVVRGQGVETLLEVARRLEARTPVDLIPGIGFKRNGKLHFSTERRFSRSWSSSAQGISSRRLQRCVERSCGRRGRCTFPAWRARSTVRIPQMPACTGGNGTRLPGTIRRRRPSILRTGYGLEMLSIVDDNFLVDLDRARHIAEGLVRAGAKFPMEHSGDYGPDCAFDS